MVFACVCVLIRLLARIGSITLTLLKIFASHIVQIEILRVLHEAPIAAPGLSDVPRMHFIC